MLGKPAIVFLACVAAAALPGCKWVFGQLRESFRAAFDSGATAKEGTLQAGLQTGPWTYYYESGQKRSAGDYADDHQVGPWTAWYENGSLSWRGSFDDSGKRTGAWDFFHDDGSRRARGRFVEDVETGLWQFWGRDGQRAKQGHFAAGQMEGIWTSWSPDGRRLHEGMMHHGSRVGDWRFWDAEGQVSQKSWPVPDALEPVADRWTDGVVRRAGMLQDGAPVGTWTSWHRSGALRMTCTFEGGVPRGAWSAHDAEGAVMAEGLINGSELRDWAVRGDDTWSAQERAPLPQLPPSMEDDWSQVTAAMAAPAAETIATWMREMRAPATPVAPEPAAEPAPAEPPPPSPRLVAEKQPDWTVREEQELLDYVKDYLEGKSPTRASRRRYAIPKARQDKPAQREELVGKPFPMDEMTTTTGELVRLSDYRGKKRVLLVILRGFSGQVCVYCVAQTEALAQCCDRFAELDLECLVVYPGPVGNEKSFLQAYRDTFKKAPPPYQMIYDPDMQMVDTLGIAGGDLAYPTTILLDEDGIVRYAYTGKHRADRPAADELIKFVRNLDK